MNNLDRIEILNSMLKMLEKEYENEKDIVVKNFLKGEMVAYKQVLTLFSSLI